MCLEETSHQLLADATPSEPPAPSSAAREDYEYVRGGVYNLFVLWEPLAGWRRVVLSERRIRIDFAHCIKELVDVHYPGIRKIVLVMDNLNTYTPASLYETFSHTEAKRLVDRLEIYYTPKHGNWLSMAKIELSVLSEQCLDRRLPDRATLTREVGGWEQERNGRGSTINWRSRPMTPVSSSSRSTTVITETSAIRIPARDLIQPLLR